MLLALCAVSGRALGQEPSVQQQLNALQQMMREMQTRHQQEMDALKKEIADQHATIGSLQKIAALPGPAVQTSPAAIPPALPAAKSPAADTPLFPTTDDSVVAPGTPPTQAAPPAPGYASAIPTTDASVLTLGSLGTGPITLAGGGKSYLNISFDAILAAAASSAHDLGSLEVGDHDPQKRGFNARNIELALDGAVDPFFEGFANIVRLQIRIGFQDFGIAIVLIVQLELLQWHPTDGIHIRDFRSVDPQICQWHANEW